jgi:hypothetical protein
LLSFAEGTAALIFSGVTAPTFINGFLHTAQKEPRLD